MGSRHLVAAYIDGAYRIAQYGHTGAYPDDQGVAILAFLQHTNHDRFKAALRRASLLTEEEMEEVENGKRPAPIETRHGSEILHHVLLAEEPLKLTDYLAFAGSSLHCEWAYVIDFDKGTFEVFIGRNKRFMATDTRFPSGSNWLAPGYWDYEPVALLSSYDLNNLPTSEQFLTDIKKLTDEVNMVAEAV
jgi:hypothetical protein